MRVLEDRGVDVKANEDVALVAAMLREVVNVVRFLLTRGARVDAKDNRALRGDGAGQRGLC
ncbi:hypothetical protein HDU93_005357, partial [Gonapodya sp. JEL0774]